MGGAAIGIVVEVVLTIVCAPVGLAALAAVGGGSATVLVGAAVISGAGGILTANALQNSEMNLGQINNFTKTLIYDADGPYVNLQIKNGTTTKDSIKLVVPTTEATLKWKTNNVSFCEPGGDWNLSPKEIVLDLNKNLANGSYPLGALVRGTETPGQGKTYKYSLNC